MINRISKIRVKASKEYDVLIGSNLIYQAGVLLREVLNPCKIAVITDDTVDALYGKIIVNALEKGGFTVVKFSFLHGEGSKNLKTYGEILDFLAENELTRTDAVIALGGGVVGDMAGFCASTYLRGIKYVQIPTTLLAQIDSSVGGKTGVDLSAGKNLVGAFCQPSLVICDTEVLNTLPDEIFNDGMGEVSKYALLDQNIYDLINGEDMILSRLIYLCIDYKRRVVEEDEFESGKRKLLNLGHTTAHGVERLSCYTIPHGKAVAMGINIILDASLKRGYIDKGLYLKMKETVVKCVGEQTIPYSIKDICNASLTDKKRSGDSITLVAVHGVGDCRTEKINVTEMEKYLK
ncbi:MAG: 3-dehydroquinate synthase [Clostridia bacterium]|nr:3-dehydroquinate synthase [Clostridia bacterium]